MKLFFILLVIFVQGSLYAFLTGQTTYPSFGQTMSRGASDFQYAGSFFITTSSYDSEGNLVSLGEQETYQLFQSDLIWRYGFSELIELGAGLRFRYISAGYTSPSNPSDDLQVAKSGIESYFVKAKYALKRSQETNWAIDAVIRQSAYENTFYVDVNQMPDDEIVLGDSGLEIELGLSGDYFFNPKRLLQGRLAYVKPGNDLSEELRYDVEHVWRKNKWDINIGTYGIYSLQSDNYGSLTTAKPRQGRSPSALFNSTNRSFVSAGAGLGYRFGSWRLDAGYRRVLRGVSTDQGHLMTFGLTKLGKASKIKENPEDRFKEYTIEAEVVKVSNRGRFIRIDKGLSSDVERGMRFDIYNADFYGNNLLVAEAVAYKVGASASILKVVNRFVRKPITSGFTARAR